MGRAAGIVLGVCLSAVGACAALEPVVIDPIGSWSGSTAQGRPISFTVKDAGVASATFSFEISSGCSQTGEIGVGEGSTPLAVIQNNRFTASREISSPINLSWSLSGEFTSSTMAEGTLQVTNTSLNCSVTAGWTATR